MNFDEILTLINSFDESSLTELKLDQDGTQLTLRRRSESNPVYTQPIMVHPQAMAPGIAAPSPATTVASPVAGAPAGSAASAPSATSGDATPESDPGIEVITSPIVGTVYRAPSPDSPPFAQEGDVIEQGKPICILEAMKVMNELEAEFAMEVVSFKVNNGDMVEFGTPIVEVRRV
jgi:acetyl-CoA carboxylase biotin carboxyl carrier protein